ncbi:MAG: beta-lactamase family protein [Actinobacteria bacterium]|nr:beta-lactamase family protein [Actinomycetota bacterium]
MVKNLMRIVVVTVILAFAACSILSCGAPEFTFEQKQEIEQLVDQTMKDNDIPGVIVGVWVPGEGEFLLAKGKADVETGQDIKLADRARIGSNTKSFVITVLLQLVDEGKVNLNDTLDKFDFGVVIPNGENITVRECCNMTSGLFNYTVSDGFQEAAGANPYRKWKPQELVEFAVSNNPYFPPGEGFEYSNTNTILIGMIIEQVIGSDLSEEIQKRILEPLKLDNTIFPNTPEMTGEYSHGYRYIEGEDNLVDVTNLLDPSATWAAGAMISNLYDLKVWAKALATGELISESAQKERLKLVDGTIEDLKVSYGLGIFAIDGFRNHAGELPGYSTAPFYNPDKEATIIVLLNKNPNNEHLASIKLLQRIAEVVLPEEN